MKVKALFMDFILLDPKVNAIMKNRTDETKEKMTVLALILSSKKVKQNTESENKIKIEIRILVIGFSSMNFFIPRYNKIIPPI